ncbi:MAG: NADPH-dependent assimilatory sulfite reductase hemoprotein subunit [Leptospiraceae bacterium]|nr:NADPH-dependent assimilatory sulfite reductase hemoprotein subunit [Leptospiraceae bacterium]
MSEEKELTKVEGFKENSNNLRGSIAEELKNGTDSFSEANVQLLKFHGMYQQKDRDRVKDENGNFVEKSHTMMIRGRIPGGRLTKEQYLLWDELGEKFGGGALRLTTRQSIQLHYLLKENIQTVIQEVYKINQSSIGACGDVVRNVTQAINPWKKPTLAQLDEVASLLSDHFKFKSNSYIELWMDGEQINKDEEDPIYGKTFLPRKFKIGVTLVGHNTIDLYTNDLGFAATLNGEGKIDGYFVFAGGGLGMTHNKPQTFPRAADLLGWVSKDQLIPISEAVVTTHRDFGDRTNRKHARLKYVIHDKGLDWFKGEVESRAKIKFENKTLPEWKTESYLGWIEAEDGTLSLGFHTLSGRIKDIPGKPLKTAIREVVKNFDLSVQLSPDQDLILIDIKKEDKTKIEELLNSQGIDYRSPHKLFDRALACPALPTCALALTESERFFPNLLSSIQSVIDKHGLTDRSPLIRMTGCPNGCARPYSAEIGIVGQQAGGKYAIFLGGDPEGTRVGFNVAVKTPISDIPSLLEKFFLDWKEKGGNKSFGDYIHSLGPQKTKDLLPNE